MLCPKFSFTRHWNRQTWETRQPYWPDLGNSRVARSAATQRDWRDCAGNLNQFRSFTISNNVLLRKLEEYQARWVFGVPFFSTWLLINRFIILYFENEFARRIGFTAPSRSIGFQRHYSLERGKFGLYVLCFFFICRKFLYEYRTFFAKVQNYNSKLGAGSRGSDWIYRFVSDKQILWLNRQKCFFLRMEKCVLKKWDELWKKWLQKHRNPHFRKSQSIAAKLLESREFAAWF